MQMSRIPVVPAKSQAIKIRKQNRDAMITAVSKRFAMRCVKNLLIFIQPHADVNLSFTFCLSVRHRALQPSNVRSIACWRWQNRGSKA